MNLLSTHIRVIVHAILITLFTGALLIAPSGSASATPLPRAKSDCGSGYFCIWSGAGYTGTIQKISATNAYKAVTLGNTRSYYNHRSYRTWLHSTSDGSGSYGCIAPGASKSSTSGWQAVAKAVYLATITNC